MVLGQDLEGGRPKEQRPGGRAELKAYPATVVLGVNQRGYEATGQGGGDGTFRDQVLDCAWHTLSPVTAITCQI